MAILGPVTQPFQILDLTLKARCFYYSRQYNVPVDFDAYKRWREANGVSRRSLPSTTDETCYPSAQLTVISKGPYPPSDPSRSVTEVNVGVSPTVATESESASLPAPYPSSFSHIVSLITKGEPIPGIRDIPDTVLEGEKSASTAERRRKPWEMNDVAVMDAAEVCDVDSKKGIVNGLDSEIAQEDRKATDEQAIGASRWD